MLQITGLEYHNPTTGVLQIPFEKPLLLAAKIISEDATIQLECWRNNTIVESYSFSKKPHFFILHPPSQCTVFVTMRTKDKLEDVGYFSSSMEWFIVDSDCTKNPPKYNLKIPCMFEFPTTLPFNFAQIELKTWPQRKSKLLASRTPFKSSPVLSNKNCFFIPCAEEPYCYQYRYRFTLGNETICISDESPVFVMEKLKFEDYFELDRDYLEATHKARVLCIHKDWNIKSNILDHNEHVQLQQLSNQQEWQNVYGNNGTYYNYYQQYVEFYSSAPLEFHATYRILLNGYTIIAPFSICDTVDNGHCMEFLKPFSCRPEYTYIVSNSVILQDYFFNCFVRIGRDGTFYAKFGDEEFIALTQWITDSSIQITDIDRLLFCESLVKEWEKEDFEYIKDVFGEIVSYLTRKELQNMRAVCKYLYSICSKRYMVLEWNTFYFKFRNTELLDKNTKSVYSFR